MQQGTTLQPQRIGIVTHNLVKPMVLEAVPSTGVLMWNRAAIMKCDQSAAIGNTQPLKVKVPQGLTDYQWSKQWAT